MASSVGRVIAKLLGSTGVAVNYAADGIQIGTTAAFGVLLAGTAGGVILPAFCLGICGLALYDVVGGWTKGKEEERVKEWIKHLTAQHGSFVNGLRHTLEARGIPVSQGSAGYEGHPLVTLYDLVSTRSDEIVQRIDEIDRFQVAVGFFLEHHFEQLNVKLDAIAVSADDVVEFRSVLDQRLRDIERATKPHPFLHLPIKFFDPRRDGDGRYLFKYRRVPMLGRWAELALLELFLASPHRLSTEKGMWWLWTGQGGLGKSRLALELCLCARAQGWDAGFLPRDSTFNDWQDWRPDRPTLVVIDYASARFDDVAKMLIRFARRTEPFPYPVRVLLLERLGEGTDWYRKFLTDRGSADAADALVKLRYDSPHELATLDDDSVWSGIESVFRERNQSPPDRPSLLAALKRMDRLRRPLFAAMAAEAIAGQPTIDGAPVTIGQLGRWNLLELVTHVLTWEIAAWKRAFDDSRPELERHVHLLTLTRLLGGLDYASIDAWSKRLPGIIPSARERRDDMCETIAGIMGGPEANEHGVCTRLPALEPDAVGECFVLARLQGLHEVAINSNASTLAEDTRRILCEAWMHEGARLSEFIILTFVTFPEESEQAGLLNPPCSHDAHGTLPKDWLELMPLLMVFTMLLHRTRASETIVETLERQLQLAADPHAKQRVTQALSDSLFNRGVTHSQQYRPDEAIADYTRAIELKDAPAEQVGKALYNRGVTHGLENRPADEIADYTRVIELKDAPVEQVAQALFNRGVTHGQQNRPDEAIADYTRVIELKDAPAEPVANALVNRGAMYGQEDRPDEAIADYTRVIELKNAPAEQVARAFLGRGTAFFMRDQRSNARADVDAARTLVAKLQNQQLIDVADMLTKNLGDPSP